MVDGTPEPARVFITAIIQSITQPLAQQPAISALDVADLRMGFEKGERGFFRQAEAGGPNEVTRAAEAGTADFKRNIRQDIRK